MLAIVLIPAALTNTFGRMVRQPRQGWLLHGVMVCVFVIGLSIVSYTEHQLGAGVTAALGEPASLANGNMEGKETRYGVEGSALTAVVTSNIATGSNNAMHDSFTPLGGMVLLVNMLLGKWCLEGSARGSTAW